eukprot:NODE_1093_length_1016_cov_116.377953_g1048_i0.p1 GENE.NODE_1093_length_1016_cov_116.377953_g1048_i0~~NODE_1093_length_1016_cov_116.377953_g1048_i0.p1  ORF type:complete len:297 (-),score=18.50 NODE_1093_length_1016_cov_116.377953_g1048_i0:126-959(-)
MTKASKSRICCNYKCVLGPDWYGVFFSTFLIVSPTVVFGVFSAPYFWQTVHPVIPILIGLLVLYVLASLWKAALTDPGILPRQIDEDDDPYQPYTKKIQVKGVDMDLKFCLTCNIYRPPRCSHCSVCNNCVDKFDHHCPWVSNCVGRRNYRYFLGFVFSLCAYGIVLPGASAAHMILYAIRNSLGFVDTLKAVPYAFAVICYCVLAMASVYFLCCFHVNLLSRSVTTNESFKYRMEHPFHRGSFWKEFCSVCLSPYYKSFVSKSQYDSDLELREIRT